MGGFQTPAQRMVVARFLLILALQAATVISMRTHFVYWNSTNPAFRLDNTDHIIDVNKGNLPWEYDQLHLICPQNGEQHVIYSVSKEDFESCRVSNSRPKIVAICNKPDSFMYSTKRDLHRRVGGYRSTHNMRMVFRVAEKVVNQDSNVVQVQVSHPRKVETTTTTTTTQAPRMWSARVPKDRQDYIYYYQPWHRRDQRLRDERLRIEEIATNEILTALPLTAGSSSSVNFSTLSAILLLLTSLRGLL